MTVLEHHARTIFLRARSSARLKCDFPSLSSYRYGHFRHFASAQDVAQTKQFYITSPIFYVNAAPHVGHLYTLILTDVLKRWQLLLGNSDATLLTGTDEHGMKIQKAAQKARVDTKLFCDQNMRHFEALWECADISHDHFIRTTDDNHKAAVEHFWTELNSRGYIYESKHEGWYSVSDETFFPQSAVHLVLDPSTGRKHMASMETGREVEWTSEINYHFRLSQFQDRLLQHYRQNPKFIVPSNRMKFIEKEVENGLNDLSISRPVSRLQWGIRVPNDDSQTIYVWLDALINYLTYTGYPGVPWTPTNSLWPPNVQVIGKDIIKFHCIYWPAFLMALDLPLPKQFLTHAFWTMNREKMSKSLGNVVSPFLAVDRFGTDTMRFYMAHDGGIQDDASYENAYIIDRYKTILQGGFGNLASRIVKSKLWNVRASVLSAVRMKFDGSDISGQGQTLRELITQTPIMAAQQMEQLNPRAALQAIMQVTYMTNKYLQHSAVWDLARAANPTDAQANLDIQRTVFTCAEALRVSAILLQPFMPSKMKMCLDWLGVHETRRTFADAQFRADDTYGIPLVEVGKAGSSNAIFPPLVAEW